MKCPFCGAEGKLQRYIRDYEANYEQSQYRCLGPKPHSFLVFPETGSRPEETDDWRLTEEEIQSVVREYFAGNPVLRQHMVESLGHWEDIAPVIAQAQARKLVEWLLGQGGWAKAPEMNNYHPCYCLQRSIIEQLRKEVGLDVENQPD